MKHLKKYIYLTTTALIHLMANAQTDGTIILAEKMPSKETSAVATQRIMLKPGFSANASLGLFSARIGIINSIYPSSITLLQGSTQIDPIPENEKSGAHCFRVQTIVPLSPQTNPAMLNEQNSIVSFEYYNAFGNPDMIVQKKTSPMGKDIAYLAMSEPTGDGRNNWMPTPINSVDSTILGIVQQQAKCFYADKKPYDTQMSDNTNNQTQEYYMNGLARTEQNKKQVAISGDTIIAMQSFRLNGGVVEKFMSGMAALLFQKSIDEDGNKTIIFSDLTGKIRLQRDITDTQNLDTYFVYDDMDRLRVVLPPALSEKIVQGGSQTGTSYSLTSNVEILQYAYIYQYDNKGNCISKKLPGREEIKLIYDSANRPAFSQDGNQRAANQWTFYRYDHQGRIAQNGTCIITDPQSMRNTALNSPATVTYQTQTGYVCDNAALQGNNPVVLVENFYDNYDFIDIPRFATLKPNLAYTTETGYGERYAKMVENTDIAPLCKLTGTSVAMTDNSRKMVTALYYDKQGNVVQTRSNNHLGGVENNWIAYNWAGMPTAVKHTQGAFSKNNTETYTYSYDRVMRPLTVRCAINALSPVLVDSLVYDQIGRVSKKIIHNNAETIKYAYNLQNQIKQIASPHFSETLNYDNTTPGNTPRYNGSIASINFADGSTTTYTYDGKNRLKSSVYTANNNGSDNGAYNTSMIYDNNGNPTQIVRSGYARDFENMNNGVAPVIPHTIDKLTLEYNGNQLKKITDEINKTQYEAVGNNDFDDEQNDDVDTEYFYDANGNLTADYNKQIAWIKYNLMNLPEKIQFANGNKITYAYDATGEKCSATYQTANTPLQIPLGATGTENTANFSTTTTINYCGRYLYRDTILTHILTPEGCLITNGTNPQAWQWTYNLQDHQGNNRVTLAANANNLAPVIENNYYPSGLEINPPTGTTSTENAYLYSGNELDRMHGLNLYDFHARFYDPAIQLFTTMDPLAETRYNESPYAFCGADPINRSDPAGLEWYWNDGAKNISDFHWYDSCSDNPDPSNPKLTYDHHDVNFTVKIHGSLIEFGKNSYSTILREVIVSDTPLNCVIMFTGNKSSGDKRDGDGMPNFTIGQNTPLVGQAATLPQNATKATHNGSVASLYNFLNRGTGARGSNQANGGGGGQQANALPIYVTVGAALGELGEAALIVAGKASMIITLLTLPGDTRTDKATDNPIFPGPHFTGRGEINNRDVKGFDNKKYGPPGGPPWWLWPVAAAAAYDLYNNWPTPNIPQPQPVKVPTLSPNKK